MPKIRYMTPEEKDFWTDEVGAVIKNGEILIHPDEPKERLPHLLRHEIGHLKFPLEIGEIEAVPGEPVPWKAKDIFRELVANYYCLLLDPQDKDARTSIKNMKLYAKLEGFSIDQISRIDRAARKATSFET